MKKKSIIVLVTLVIILWQYGFKLEYQHDRNRTYTLSSIQKAQIKEETFGMSEQELYRYSIKYTSQSLSFSQRNNISNGHANCIGYATMCSAVYNYGVKANHLHGRSKPVVGYVTFCGINLCEVLKCLMPNKRLKEFMKDHDFVAFYYDGQTIYADASAYDLMFNDCKTTKK